MAVKRFKVGFCVVATALAVGGCTVSPGSGPSSQQPGGDAAIAASAPPWTEPAKYGFVLDRQCAGAASRGRYKVAVASGAVVTADRIDGKTAAGEEEVDVPSLRELLEMAQTAADDGGAVTTTLDPADGHPTEVSIDVSDENGPACFVISDYAVAR